MTKFKDLAIGDTFDFIGPDRYNSFYERCTKTSARKYSWTSTQFSTKLESRVGSVNAEVFNVQRAA